MSDVIIGIIALYIFLGVIPGFLKKKLTWIVSILHGHLDFFRSGCSVSRIRSLICRIWRYAMTPDQVKCLEDSRKYEIEVQDWERKIREAESRGDRTETIRWLQKMRDEARHYAKLNLELATDRGY